MSAQALAYEAELARALPTFECRVHERYVTDLQTSCQPIAAHGARDITWPAKIKDISLGGIALVLQRRFERGAALAVELPSSPADSACTVLARVVHASAQADGSWLLGCSFVRQLSVDGLHALLSYAQRQRSLPAVEATDSPSPVFVEKPKRRGPIPASQPPKRILITGVHFKGTTEDGETIRRFITRLYLSGPWPLVTGTLVKGWVGKERDRSPSFKMEVVVCRLYDNQWKLSCKFVGTPLARVRHLFRLRGHEE